MTYMTVREQKQLLRKEIKQTRRSMSSLEHMQKSQQICSYLLHHPDLQNAHHIAGYSPMHGEIDITPLLIRYTQQHKTTMLPHWQLGRPMTFVPEGLIDAIIIPGLAFDQHGFRLGYGKGYYDAFLSHLPSNIPRIGVCFDYQLIKDIPLDSWDQKVSSIVTDKGIHYLDKLAT